ncbi:dephospho-CoA kinase [Pseudoxanthomonas composti]|uniref:Dephospho-CoA kinase n=1 Tax=Pseudoxanthomonas composti TaxID=2137479 RepID=A0A4V1N0S2_9GAMM|nr:dephospho-CoA kinase [Pseudoxanthomonas composti]RXR01434.1 dephospho-CoA kinase [Pseudoxanthomonas composti]
MSDYIIGLTGGIASGKSALEAAFLRRGIAVLDADAVARAVVEPGQPALAAIVAHFGRDVLTEDGRLDRALLRRRVFEDEAQRKALEALLHPPIRAALHAGCVATASPYAVAMIPLLTEGGARQAYPWLDRILVVDVPVELQHRRLINRDGIDATLADRMIAAQSTRAQRLEVADDVVGNDQDLDALEAHVEELDRRYRQLAAAKAKR